MIQQTTVHSASCLGRMTARPCRSSRLPMLFVATHRSGFPSMWLLLQQQQHRQRGALFSTKTGKNETKIKHKHENSVLLARPLPDPPSHHERPFRWPRTFQEWKLVLTTTWRNYASTWEGFPHGNRTTSTKQTQPDSNEHHDDDDDQDDFVNQLKKNIRIPQSQDEVVDNVKQNLTFMQDEGTDLVNKAKEETGIYTKEDLKKWAGEQMKLATECLSEFMVGYRKGRDTEVDKMLHEYFQDLEDDDDKEEGKPKGRRRRKPKRRKRKF